MTIARHWIPIAMLDACRNWTAKHGAPPKSEEWSEGSIDHPAASNVTGTFGSWGAMIAAAGYTPRRGPKVWTRDRIVEAFIVWRDHHGRWPIQKDWGRSTVEHPVYTTVRNEFGSWDAGRRAAGYRGPLRATTASLRRAQRRELVGMVNAGPIASVLTRELAGRPLSEVAAECDVDPTYLSKIVRGVTTRLRATKADQILTALDHPHVLEAARVAA